MTQDHPFHWFGPETTAELCTQLMQAGECRLEVRGHGEHMTLQVVPHDALTLKAMAFEPLNKSHICPPSCP